MTPTEEGPEFVRPRQRHEGTIHLAEHDPTWAVVFAEQAALIREALGERAVAVEHAGSTSVPGLAAKPIIDIVLVVEDPTDEASYVPALEAAGFPFHVREPGWHQHRFFKRSAPAVNLHVFGAGSVEVQRMLAFRDRLRSHPEELELYERCKRELAARQWEYVQDYADAKSEVVEDILTRALGRQA